MSPQFVLDASSMPSHCAVVRYDINNTNTLVTPMYLVRQGRYAMSRDVMYCHWLAFANPASVSPTQGRIGTVLALFKPPSCGLHRQSVGSCVSHSFLILCRVMDAFIIARDIPKAIEPDSVQLVESTSSLLFYHHALSDYH
jgi:hypothetical protein